MILVTGAGGYIGRRLVARLLADGQSVRCLVTAQHARALLEDSALETHVHDEPDDALWAQLVDGAHCVIHLRSAMWWGRVQDLRAIEIEGTRALIRAARSAHVRTRHIGKPSGTRRLLLGYRPCALKACKSNCCAKADWHSPSSAAQLVFGEADSFISHLAAILRANPFFFAQPGRGEYLLQPIYVGDLVEAIARFVAEAGCGR